MPVESLAHCPYLAQAAFDAPVGLLLVRAGNRTNAMTVSFFSEVAHHPTSMWLSIARATYTHNLLEETRDFSFITLAAHQADIAISCGTSSGRDVDKCRALDLYETGGFLFLRGAIASTACRVERNLPLQDHVLWIAHLLHGNIERGRGAVRNLLLSDLKAR